MKLYKLGPGKWAAKARLDTVNDIDVEVNQSGCGRTVTTVRIASSACPEGMIMSFDYDGIRVYAYDEHNTFLGSDKLERGTAKMCSWTELPAIIRIGTFKQITLEYE